MGQFLQSEIDQYTRENSRSAELNERATGVFPGGDTRNAIWWSPFPTYVTHAEGSRIVDVDGHERVDFINNMTTLILGHSHPAVVSAVQDQLPLGFSFPAPSPPMIRWAEIMQERVPSVERLRFVNSGTEATMNAIRAARAFTGKELVAKIEGGYHGAHDFATVSVGTPLDKAGDQTRPNSVLISEGVPRSVADSVLVLPANDLETADLLLRERSDNLAAMIVEPVWGQGGMIPTEDGYLKGLRSLADELGFLLIFDEVISFRLSSGGAQQHYDVKPDLTAFGKIIGGGMPVGAFGGREDIMSVYSPEGGAPRVPHSGTFNGNPVAAAAGIATLEALTPSVYGQINALGDRLRSRFQEIISEREAPMGVTGIGSLFSLQFTTEQVRDYRSSASNDNVLRQAVFLGLMNEGFLLGSRGAGNISTAHTNEEIDSLVDAFGKVLGRVGFG